MLTIVWVQKSKANLDPAALPAFISSSPVKEQGVGEGNETQRGEYESAPLMRTQRAEGWRKQENGQ